MCDVESERKVTTDSIAPDSKPTCARKAAFDKCGPIAQLSVPLGRLQCENVDFNHGEPSLKGVEDLME